MALVVPRIPDSDTQRALDDLASQLDERLSGLGSSVALVTVALSTAENRVRHGLGRKPVGWRIVDIDADVRVWRSDAMSATSLPLTASADATAIIEVF